MRWAAVVGALVCALGWGCGGSGDSPGAHGGDAGLPPSFQEGDTPAARDCINEASTACDLVTGCGCAHGQACRADANLPGAAVCAPLAPAPQAPYSLCESDLQCPALYSCIDSVCKKMCREPEDCGWQGAQCRPTRDANDHLLPANYCTRSCDVASPQAPDPGFQACGAGVGCVVAGDGTDCFGAAGAIAQGQACEPGADCAAGLYCSQAGRCEQWCKLGGDDCPGQRCVASAKPLVAGGVSFGTCTCELPEDAPCDVVTGCGCAEGTTCGVLDGRVGCRPLAASPQPPLSQCAASGQCPALHSCISGVCQQQCSVAADCAAAGARCLPILAAPNEAIPGIGYCSNDCEPAAPQAPRRAGEACGAGLQCFPTDGARLCTAAGSSGVGAACTSSSACAPGLFCSVSGECQPWCEVGTNDCGSGRACRSFAPALLEGEPGVPGSHEYGRCECAPANGDLCDPSSDCGCESGGTCFYFPDEQAFDCRAIDVAPLAPHAACNSSTSCPALHACLGGVCRRLCGGPLDCTGPASRCEPVSDDPAHADWKACTISCDPLAPASPRAGFEACPAGAQCVLSSLGSDCIGPAGPVSEGGACQSPLDCAPGLFCGLGRSCQSYCELGSSSCGVGLECQGFDFLLRSAGHDFGRCACTPVSGSGCDLANDCGCDPGTSCAPLSFKEPLGNVCDERSHAPAQPNGLCASDFDCPSLYSCLGGVCTQRCATVDDCEGTAVSCSAVTNDEDQPIAGFNLCSRHCNPISPNTPPAGFDACLPGTQCLPADQGSFCVKAGTGTLGSPCQAFDACQPGLFCGGGQCRAWCLMGANDCVAPEVCARFSTPLVTVDGEWGQCSVCSDDCAEPNGLCEDGGLGSASSSCSLGSDCTDCGAR